MLTHPTTLPPLPNQDSSVPPLASVLPNSSTRKSKQTFVNRLVRYGMMIGFLGVLVWISTNWGSSRKTADVVTTPATVGELVIAVTEKGELESAESIQVACEVEGGGKLVMIVPEGTQVKKNDIVVRFDTDVLLKAINEQEVKWEQAEGKVKAATSELEVQRNKADSEIAKAELALTLAKLDYESYEEGEFLVELDKRKGTLELARKEMKEAEDNLDFTRGMVKKGFAQLEQIRVMELTVEGKRYAVRQQDADLRVFEKFTKVRKLTELKAKAEEAKRDLERTKKSQAAATEKSVSELAAAQKTAGLEKRQLERLQAQLEKCEVKAPQDGIVIYYKRPWDESSRIRQGASVVFQQPIFTLPDLGRMKVKVKIHESVIKKVHPGLTASMRVDAFSNQILNGKVLRVATLAQSEDWRGGGVKEYETSVSIDELPPEAGLRPGMSAEVRILVKKIPHALVVPVQSVTEVGGRHVCYVVSGSQIDQREVKIGEGNEQLVQILEGINENEQVALDARTRAAAELDKGKPTTPSTKEPESSSASTSKGL